MLSSIAFFFFSRLFQIGPFPAPTCGAYGGTTKPAISRSSNIESDYYYTGAVKNSVNEPVFHGVANQLCVVAETYFL